MAHMARISGIAPPFRAATGRKAAAPLAWRSVPRLVGVVITFRPETTRAERTRSARPGRSEKCQKQSGARLRLFDHAIRFDLDEPRGIDEARNLDKRASRANVTKNLAMRAGGIAPTRNGGSSRASGESQTSLGKACSSPNRAVAISERKQASHV